MKYAMRLSLTIGKMGACMHMEAEESRSVSAASSVVLQGSMGVRELLLETNAGHPIENNDRDVQARRGKVVGKRGRRIRNRARSHLRNDDVHHAGFTSLAWVSNAPCPDTGCKELPDSHVLRRAAHEVAMAFHLASLAW